MKPKIYVESLLDWLIEETSKIEMTPEMVDAQRKSFAYGNCKLSNPNITRELVDEVFETLNKKD